MHKKKPKLRTIKGGRDSYDKQASERLNRIIQEELSKPKKQESKKPLPKWVVPLQNLLILLMKSLGFKNQREDFDEDF